MLSEETRKRLSQLNKGSLKALPGLISARDLKAKQQEEKAQQKTEEVRPATPLAGNPGETNLEIVEQGDLTPPEGGDFWLLDRCLSTMWAKAPALHGEYCRFFDQTGIAGTPEDYHPDWGAILECSSKDICYLDIETCGFSGTPVFLVGVLHVDDDDIRMKQFFARDYAEEAPMLASLWEFLDQFRAVVTFNGKTFDIPFITERAFYHRVKVAESFHHFDLLHESRRRWKKHLPDCKLQTLERYICRRARSGDIPGALIPEAYHNFVRTGDATEMNDVLHHNALDLLTLAEIVLFALQGKDIWE